MITNKTFYVKATDDTPSIFYKPEEKQLEMSGRFTSSDKPPFLSPVCVWLDEYATIALPLQLVFAFDYLRQENSKYVLDILITAEKIQQASACWKYAKQNETMHDIGQEFSHITKIPFQLMSM